MLRMDIPGYGSLKIEHLVLDYNGTLALDGRMLPGVRPRLRRVARFVKVHVVTADTFGTVRRALHGLPCRIVVLGARRQDRAKRDYVRKLGADRTACIGNGRNDRLMLRAARLGIAVIQTESAASEAIMASNLVSPSIADALDLFVHPLRLTAALRA